MAMSRPTPDFAMRQIAIFATALVVAGGYAARYVDRATETPADAQPAVVQPADEPREPSNSGRSLMVESDRQGHFQVEARVEGRFMDFVVDTGASLVVLRESSSAMAGIRPQPRDYTAVARTANGKIKAAPAKIDRIEIGGISVYDVPAMVLPDEALAKKPVGRFISLTPQTLRIRQRPIAARTIASLFSRPVAHVPRVGPWWSIVGALFPLAALGYWTPASIV
jgi:aspartyl protease family protein